jgi:O-antigen ligase
MSLRSAVARLPQAAPAFFLALAIMSGGLRSPAQWLFFGALFLCWFVLWGAKPAASGPEAPLLFFAWLAAAALFSPEPLVSIGFFARYAVLGLLFFSAVSAEAGAGAWLLAVYGAGSVAALMFLMERGAGLPALGLIGGNPNYSAVFCAAAFPAATLGVSVPGGSRRPAYALLALLLAAGIAASGSRGAALAAFLAVAAGLGLAGRWRWLGGLLVAAAAAAVFLPSPVWVGVLKFSDPRAFARPSLWGSALRAAAASPLLGWGPGRFDKVFEIFKFPYFDGVSFYGHSTLHAHGELFNLAAEAGFPAAAFFLLAAAQALVSGGVKKLPLKLCALAALLEGGVDMIFYSGAVALLFWGSLGYGAESRPAGKTRRPLWAALAVCCLAGLALPSVQRFMDGSQAFAAAAYGEASAGNDPVLAMALLKSAQLDNPKDPFIAEAEGRGLAALGDLSGAGAAFNRALALEPGFAGAKLGLARVDAALGRSAQACSELPVPYGGLEPDGRYQAAIAALDMKELERLKKEICSSRKTGGATAPGRKTR